jgi:hypothetical protein
LACFAAVLSTLLIIPLAARANHAHAAREREHAKASRVVEQANRIGALRAELASDKDAMSPGSDAPLATRVSAALAASGLEQSTLAGLSPESLSQQSGSQTTLRSRATLTLQNLTLPELGTFIAAWRDREPAWSITSLEMAPLANARAIQKPGADLPIRAVLILETLRFENQTP